MLGNTIGQYRRKLGLTQEQLAQKLEVTNQAVSKWEGNQCCPDVQLLPKLADILGISLDTLFGRPAPEAPAAAAELPWPDDDQFHVVLYCGHELVGSSRGDQDCTFHYEGPVRDIYCEANLQCDEVQGNVTAGGYVECGDVSGHVSAGGYVECGDVVGNLSAGGYVECGDVAGSVAAGDYVECGDVCHGVTAGNYVECGDVNGSIFASGGFRSTGSMSSDEEEDQDDDEGTTVIISKEKKGADPVKFSMNFFKHFWKEDEN